MISQVTSDISRNWWSRQKVAGFDFQRQLQYAIYNASQDPKVSQPVKQQLSKLKNPNDAIPLLKSIGHWDEKLTEMQRMYSWYNDQFRHGYGQNRPQIAFNPEAPDNFGIRIRGLKLPPPEQAAQIPQLSSLYSTMGGSMRQEGSDILLMSEPKVWQTFLQSAQTWFPAGAANLANAPVAVMPDERKASGQPLADVLKKYKNTFALPKAAKPNKKLNAMPVPGKDGVAAGIAINFDPTDPILNEIQKSQTGSNYVSTGIEPQLKAIWPQSTGVKWHYNELQGQVIILADPNSPTQFQRYDTLIKWLDSLGYNTDVILDVLSQIAPDKYQKKERQDNKEELNRESSPEEIQLAMITNVRGASQAAVKYLASTGAVDANGQPIDFTKIYNPKDPLNQEKLFEAIQNHVRQIYPLGFTHGRDEMGEGQAAAIAFGATRDSFILADEPGSGKTFMAAAIADLNKRIVEANKPALQGQGQILVLTPGALISENWMSKVKDGKTQPAAPKQFIDPNLDEATDIQIINDYGANGEIPDFTGKWVVIPYDMFRPLGDEEPVRSIARPKKGIPDYNEQMLAYQEDQKIIARNEVKKKRKKRIEKLVNKILKNKRFVTCIMDESQCVKNDEADSTSNVHAAIAAITKKVAMTGTPSDDNPRDFYGMLQLIDYPGIERNGGEQSIASFCRQYFAGYGTSDKPTAEDLRANILEHVGSARRFMDMICNFFLRRTKDQINPGHKGRHNHDNLNIIDEHGQPIVADEKFWANTMAKAYRTAAENKALKGLDSKTRNNARDVYNNLNPGVPIDEGQVQEIMRNGLQPQEKQQALLIQVALQKAHTTAQQAIDHLKNTSMFDEKVKDQAGNDVLGPPTPKMKAERGPNGKPLRDQNGQIVYKQVLDAHGQPVMEQKPQTQPKQVPSKVLILTGSVPAAKLIEHLIIQKTGDKDLVSAVVGGTKDDDRSTRAVAFQNATSNPRILIFTVKLGSVGYNFDVADLCIVNDPPWNPSLLEQGVNRVDRSMGKYKPTVVYNVLSNDASKANRGQNPTNGSMSIDDMQYKLIDAKGEANAAVQTCLQEAAEIRKTYANNPMERESALDKLAERFVQSFANSLDAAEQARLFYNPPKAEVAQFQTPAPQTAPPIAASGWYKRFKMATKQYKHLW